MEEILKEKLEAIWWSCWKRYGGDVVRDLEEILCEIWRCKRPGRDVGIDMKEMYEIWRCWKRYGGDVEGDLEML